MRVPSLMAALSPLWQASVPTVEVAIADVVEHLDARVEPPQLDERGATASTTALSRLFDARRKHPDVLVHRDHERRANEIAQPCFLVVRKRQPIDRHSLDLVDQDKELFIIAPVEDEWVGVALEDQFGKKPHSASL